MPDNRALDVLVDNDDVRTAFDFGPGQRLQFNREAQVLLTLPTPGAG